MPAIQNIKKEEFQHSSDTQENFQSFSGSSQTSPQSYLDFDSIINNISNRKRAWKDENEDPNKTAQDNMYQPNKIPDFRKRMESSSLSPEFKIKQEIEEPENQEGNTSDDLEIDEMSLKIERELFGGAEFNTNDNLNCPVENQEPVIPKPVISVSMNSNPVNHPNVTANVPNLNVIKSVPGSNNPVKESFWNPAFMDSSTSNPAPVNRNPPANYGPTPNTTGHMNFPGVPAKSVPAQFPNPVPSNFQPIPGTSAMMAPTRPVLRINSSLFNPPPASNTNTKFAQLPKLQTLPASTVPAPVIPASTSSAIVRPSPQVNPYRLKPTSAQTFKHVHPRVSVPYSQSAQKNTTVVPIHQTHQPHNTALQKKSKFVGIPYRISEESEMPRDVIFTEFVRNGKINYFFRKLMAPTSSNIQKKTLISCLRGLIGEDKCKKLYEIFRKPDRPVNQMVYLKAPREAVNNPQVRSLIANKGVFPKKQAPVQSQTSLDRGPPTAQNQPQSQVLDNSNQIERFGCDICKFRYKSVEALQLHRLDIFKHPCRFCKTIFKNQCNWKVHIEKCVIENQFPFKCAVCKDLFRTMVETIKHLETHYTKKQISLEYFMKLLAIVTAQGEKSMEKSK